MPPTITWLDDFTPGIGTSLWLSVALKFRIVTFEKESYLVRRKRWDGIREGDCVNNKLNHKCGGVGVRGEDEKSSLQINFLLLAPTSKNGNPVCIFIPLSLPYTRFNRMTIEFRVVLFSILSQLGPTFVLNSLVLLQGK